MSWEANILNEQDLEKVTGGHHETGSRSGINDCPPGTIEVKNELYPNEGHKHKHCINCDSKDLTDRFFFMVDTGTLFEGQECEACHTRWITHGC